MVLSAKSDAKCYFKIDAELIPGKDRLRTKSKTDNDICPCSISHYIHKNFQFETPDNSAE